MITNFTCLMGHTATKPRRCEHFYSVTRVNLWKKYTLMAGVDEFTPSIKCIAQIFHFPYNVFHPFGTMCYIWCLGYKTNDKRVMSSVINVLCLDKFNINVNEKVMNSSCLWCCKWFRNCLSISVATIRFQKEQMLKIQHLAEPLNDRPQWNNSKNRKK